MKSIKGANTPPLESLFVGDIEYDEDQVPDGFYAALKNLKTPDFLQDDHYISMKKLHDDIIDIAKAGPPISPLSFYDMESILKSLNCPWPWLFDLDIEEKFSLAYFDI